MYVKQISYKIIYQHLYNIIAMCTCANRGTTSCLAVLKILRWRHNCEKGIDRWWWSLAMHEQTNWLSSVQLRIVYSSSSCCCQVGIVLCVAIVTFDLSGGWDLFISGGDNLIGYDFTLTLVSEGGILRNSPVHASREHTIWAITYNISLFIVTLTSVSMTLYTNHSVTT